MCEGGSEEEASVRVGRRGDRFRGPFCDEEAASIASIRSEVEDPVRGLDDVEVVFNHDDGVSCVNESIDDNEQFADVFKMEACRGFIEDVKCVAGGDLGELA